MANSLEIIYVDVFCSLPVWLSLNHLGLTPEIYFWNNFSVALIALGFWNLKLVCRVTTLDGTEFGEGDATKQKSMKRNAFSLNEGRGIQ